jgi:HK97 family phage prohead protease
VKLQKRADAAADALPEIVGLAAVYYNANDPAGTQYQLWDNYFERIMPGAFDRAVKEDDVRALQNHDPRLLLGRSAAGTLALELASEGLAYRITPPPTSVGRDTVTLLERGDLDGSSFAFQISTGGVEWSEERVKVAGNEITIYVRNIKAVDLYDVLERELLRELRRPVLAGRHLLQALLDDLAGLVHPLEQHPQPIVRVAVPPHGDLELDLAVLLVGLVLARVHRHAGGVQPRGVLERAADASGHTYAEMMERAGRAVAQVVQECVGDRHEIRIHAFDGAPQPCFRSVGHVVFPRRGRSICTLRS